MAFFIRCSTPSGHPKAQPLREWRGSVPVLRVAKAVELAGAIALIGLSLLATVAEAQVPLKAELELAAEVQALAQACRELQPELAEHVDTTVNDW
jgi:hypothetical protein